MTATLKTVLVVEDDAAIRQGIVDALTYEQYRVLEAGTSKDGRDMATGADCDLVLLDLVLPGGDGLDILQSVREVRPTLPVIIMTARGDEADRIRGLKLGADDYVVKPFSIREMLARVEAVLRRSPARPMDVTRVNLSNGYVDLQRSEVRLDTGESTELSQREAELIRYLAQHAGRTVTRDELLSNVWRIDPSGLHTRTVDMHIARLREKLPSDAITTIRGKGYQFARVDVVNT